MPCSIRDDQVHVSCSPYAVEVGDVRHPDMSLDEFEVGDEDALLSSD